MEKKRKSKEPRKICRQRECDNYEIIAAHLRIIVNNVNCCLHRMTGEKYIKQMPDES